MNTLKIVAAVGLLACTLALGACEEASPEDFAQVQNGMTLSQVEAILGSGKDETASAGYGVSGGGVLGAKATDEKTYVWEAGREKLVVVFKDGKVVQSQRMPK